MQRAQATWLTDGARLHLHHGPIDMIVGIDGPGRAAGFARAARRFDSLLEELVAELPLLRQPTGPPVRGETARRMHAATRPFAARFITPMAAVAGAGADTVLAAVTAGDGIARAYVNNGGDVALHLSPGAAFEAAIAATPPARIRLSRASPVRGIATSGRGGRSHSLGIADSVTVLARNAGEADAAATMIANAVDLPGHPAIRRQPACALAPDSDLGHRRVTTGVGRLRDDEVARALAAGADLAERLLARQLISGAFLTLRGRSRSIGQIALSQRKDTANA